ncbi:uncharacterized protein LOC121419303 [Lytechinus variegatus]|uniref:uncharacterized protein LOC121419303 n=1 Tax=Lytechinus variegatus TaxID=7654 RepID=UPI001BB1D351|nr:uncharacterized protein LOC121419303 [Lytechinus variegatus]
MRTEIWVKNNCARVNLRLSASNVNEMASPNEKTPTKRKRENMTEQHIQILCAYVREKRSVLFGKPLSPTDRVSDQRKQAWENIAKQLSATGCPRSGDDVRKAWSDLKKRAKKYEDDKKKTGGGSYRFKPMLEEVLLTISDKALHGIKGQNSETGATQPCSQNTEACNLLHQMGQVEDDDVERLGDGEEDQDQDQENPPPKKRNLVSQGNLYQEMLLRNQEAMLETQQGILATLNAMLGVLQEYVSKHD